MDINTKLNEAKLVLIVGEAGSGKSKVIRDYSADSGVPILDLNTIFATTPSSKLLSGMKQFLDSYHQKVLLVDNKSVLYTKEDEIDLLSFLKVVSKDIPVVATWNGKVADGLLSHYRNGEKDVLYPVDDSIAIIEA